jgi:GH25 family lysozyme M1 (1,4-beta-N-acetylmuramidase)
MRFGIDLSANNPHPIDYAAVAGALRQLSTEPFALIKATENDDYVNPYFGTDYFGFRDQGVQVGAYLFWHFENLNITAQVDWFCQHYGWVEGDMLPYIDAEYNPTNRPWHEIATTLNEARAQLKAKGGYPEVGVYFDRSWQAALNSSGVFEPCPEWVAQGVACAPGSIMQFAPMEIAGSGPYDFDVA